VELAARDARYFAERVASASRRIVTWEPNATAVAVAGSGCGSDFAALHLHGLTSPLSNEPMGKRGHIGDRSATGIRLVLSDDPERLAATVAEHGIANFGDPHGPAFP
jgi:hypothetical protein